MRGHIIVAGLLAASSTAAPLAAAPCPATGPCTVRLSAEQVLHTAEKLVLERKFTEAGPLIAALENAPQYKMQREFLIGYVDAETGDLDGAIGQFRTILRDHPEQTRVRLELARALMLKGQDFSAEHHLRLAAKDQGLPPEVAATIRSQRGVLRDRRTWHFDFNFGLAPDTNINSATRSDSVDVVFGGGTIPLNLDPDARAKSGVGRTGGFSGGVRLRMAPKTAMLVDVDSQISDYKGSRYDDISTQIAVGPEFKLSERTSMSVQALGAQRWYGGQTASTQAGVKFGAQRYLDQGERIGLQFDVRNSIDAFSHDYRGWSLGAYGTYERVVGKTMIASASLFARRDMLNAGVYSNSEFGLNLGVGGEFPLGLNAGISGGISHVAYDAPMLIFSANARHDFRLNGRIYVGARSLHLFGFSPSITYSYVSADSNYILYKTNRNRISFSLARYL
jgi:hypothetical protein